MVETCVQVKDRTWMEMVDGCIFTQWPGEEPPAVGTRVTVFDRNLEFLWHDVVEVDGHKVKLGPAIEM